MKVMIPINKTENGTESIASGFHNAKFVCISDTTTKKVEYITSTSISVNSGSLVDQIKNMGVDAIISSYLPPMTLRIFSQGGLSVFRARGTKVDENISFLNQEQLEYFTSEESRQMWGCESGCSSCSSKSCA